MRHSKETIERAAVKVSLAIDAVNDSCDLLEFKRNVEELERIRIELNEAAVPNPLAGGNGALDVEILASSLRSVIAALVDASLPISNADIQKITGLPKGNVSLTTYYLRAIEVVSFRKEGRAYVHELARMSIRRGAVRRAWTSIQQDTVQPVERL